ncbi:alpha/beta hydrolase [Glutamicibacter arilaitensis]|uniref:alpha/beta hydrolase n=1 Tax=Glutamicibacter arilaitensis TaxID=256701 RepID=UPI00384D5990
MSHLLSDVRSPEWNRTPETGAVLLFLHGYGSHENDLSSLAEPLGLNLPWASLRAPLELGQGAAAWFQITTPGVPDAAPVEAATEAIWHWIDENIDSDTKIIPIGFSQGGLMASQLLRTRPERVLATTILGGFVLGGGQPADAKLAEQRPAVFWGRGTEDRVIAPVAIARTSEFLPKHSSLTERTYPGLAHGINLEELNDVRGHVTAQLATLPVGNE